MKPFVKSQPVVLSDKRIFLRHEILKQDSFTRALK